MATGGDVLDRVVAETISFIFHQSCYCHRCYYNYSDDRGSLHDRKPGDAILN